MRPIGAGIVGTGRISDLHAIEYLRSDAARIVAVCDQARDLATTRATAWDVPQSRAFVVLDELLACDEVDLVEILLPHDLHLSATLAALAAGKAVSVQKPMATGLADGLAMVASAERGGRFLKVFENFVFYPPVQKAKALLDEGAIGEPLTIRIKSVFGDPRRASQVRTGVVVHGHAGGGSRLDRPHGSGGRYGRRAGDDLVPLPGQPTGRVRGGACQGPADRHAALRAGRPDRDHR